MANDDGLRQAADMPVTIDLFIRQCMKTSN